MFRFLRRKLLFDPFNLNPFLYLQALHFGILNYEKQDKEGICKVLGKFVCVYVYSNSRDDVLRVAKRYGTIAAHTRRRASVLVVFVVFLRAYVQFCRFDKADATAYVQGHCNHRPPL